MRRRCGFTLAEMIAAIALLAVFSVVIVQLFAASGQLTRRTDRLDCAVISARNLAECWQAMGDGAGRPADAASKLDEWSMLRNLKPAQSIRIFLDDQQAVATAETAFLQTDVRLSADPGTGVETLRILVLDMTGNPVFELSANRLPQPEAKR